MSDCPEEMRIVFGAGLWQIPPPKCGQVQRRVAKQTASENNLVDHVLVWDIFPALRAVSGQICDPRPCGTGWRMGRARWLAQLVNNLDRMWVHGALHQARLCSHSNRDKQSARAKSLQSKCPGPALTPRASHDHSRRDLWKGLAMHVQQCRKRCRFGRDDIPVRLRCRGHAPEPEVNILHDGLLFRKSAGL